MWQGLGQGFQLIIDRDPELLRIVVLSLAVSLSATAIATCVGLPLGAILAISRFPGQGIVQTAVNTGMGLPPVVVGLVVTMFLWRSGPLGALALLYTPLAMVFVQLILCLPIAAGLTRSALELLEPELASALRISGAAEVRVAYELLRAAQAQVLVAVAAAFGRAIAEVGASLMVGGNIAGQTRVLTTGITLATSRGDFAQAIALGTILLVLAFAVNSGLAWRARAALVS